MKRNLIQSDKLLSNVEISYIVNCNSANKLQRNTNDAKYNRRGAVDLCLMKTIIDACNTDRVQDIVSKDSASVEFFLKSMVSKTSLCGSPNEKRIIERERSDIKILIAEDNDSNYLLMKVLLKEYNITRACNGLDAVKLMRDQKFDVVLMDIRMPIMDGAEATMIIREFNTSTPIIAVTANAFDEDKKRAYNAGVNDFLTKPISKEQLIESINQF